MADEKIRELLRGLKLENLIENFESKFCFSLTVCHVLSCLCTHKDIILYLRKVICRTVLLTVEKYGHLHKLQKNLIILLHNYYKPNYFFVVSFCAVG